MKRHEVMDEQWEVIQPILPKRTAKTGHPFAAEDRERHGELMPLGSRPGLRGGVFDPLGEAGGEAVERMAAVVERDLDPAHHTVRGVRGLDLGAGDPKDEQHGVEVGMTQ